MGGRGEDDYLGGVDLTDYLFLSAFKKKSIFNCTAKIHQDVQTFHQY